MRLILIVLLFVAIPSPAQLTPTTTSQFTIKKKAYENRLRGFWLGASIANWTGLSTENLRAAPPFFTDNDWGSHSGRDGQRIDFFLNAQPWGADDDTDIEYVYQRALEKSAGFVLSPQEIADAWLAHIGLPLLWVSNLAALGQMQNGVLPPLTSLPGNNPMWEMIDAQLTTELFGALAPGRPDVALAMARLPIRTTARRDAAWAAEFYVVMHALAAIVDPKLNREQQVFWIARQARKRLPPGSYVADMFDFVEADYLANPDYSDWERTRDRVYERYQRDGAAAYQYKYPWDSGINFASSLVSLFYGRGDFKNTVRIGTLAGWDSDNPTATWGGFLGLLYGHTHLRALFQNQAISDNYNIARTRYGFDTKPDSFSAMAARAMPIIDRAVAMGMGGQVTDTHWRIPEMVDAIAAAENPVTDGAVSGQPWQTIEDSDPRWQYRGFTTLSQQWNASGATLTEGRADCSAHILFSGKGVRYYAYRNETSGSVFVSVDGENPREVNLARREAFDPRQQGQFYAKVFERLDLSPGEHRLSIHCDDTRMRKTIDMLSVLP